MVYWYIIMHVDIHPDEKPARRGIAVKIIYKQGCVVTGLMHMGTSLGEGMLKVSTALPV